MVPFTTRPGTAYPFVFSSLRSKFEYFAILEWMVDCAKVVILYKL